MSLYARYFGAAALIVSAVAIAGCTDVQEAIPGNSYARANSSLAIQTWEATAALALASVPTCNKHNLINTEVVSVSEPLEIVGAQATRGKWAERWTYDMCGTTVRTKVEYEVDDVGVGYRVSIEA